MGVQPEQVMSLIPQHLSDVFIDVHDFYGFDFGHEEAVEDRVVGAWVKEHDEEINGRGSTDGGRRESLEYRGQEGRRKGRHMRREVKRIL
jgi:hypothetical protein